METLLGLYWRGHVHHLVSSIYFYSFIYLLSRLHCWAFVLCCVFFLKMKINKYIFGEKKTKWLYTHIRPPLFTRLSFKLQATNWKNHTGTLSVSKMTFLANFTPKIAHTDRGKKKKSYQHWALKLPPGREWALGVLPRSWVPAGQATLRLALCVPGMSDDGSPPVVHSLQRGAAFRQRASASGLSLPLYWFFTCSY